MNFDKLEHADIIRRFSTKFDNEYYLIKYDSEGEDSTYVLLKVVGTFSISPSLSSEFIEKGEKIETK